VLFTCLAAASPEDWNQFRGPRRDDISTETGLLKSWPKGGPKLAWKYEGIGEGFSSVSVVGDKVFTMGDKGGASHLFALSRDKGAKLWELKVGKPGGNYTGTRCTPTVDGDLVYALGQFGDLVCAETATGTEKWRVNFSKDFKGHSGGWNYTESPLVDGDRLVCTSGGPKAGIVALDKKTGAVIWKSDTSDQAGYSSIVISNACGIKQYVQLTSAGVVSVGATDGKELWRYGKFAGNTANIPTPIVLGDQIFTTAGYGRGGALLTLSSDGTGKISVKEEYYNRELNSRHGGALIVGDYAYADTDDSGRVWCAEWKTGKLKWKKEKSLGSGSASPTYADGNLYIRYANGYVALVPAGPDGYKETGMFKIPNGTGNCWAHPVVCGGRMYIREKDTLWVYEVK
jgi:outer membrane protein assembly factor BamB